MKDIIISEIIQMIKEGTATEEQLREKLETLYWTGHLKGIRECECQGEELYNP